MRAPRQRVVYLHGFNSSPASLKARQFADYCAARDIEVDIPALSPDPAQALRQIEACVGRHPEPALLVGSSLGGYYASCVAERLGLRAALINPAVAPFEHLGSEFLGLHRNPHTGEQFEFNATHVAALRAMSVERISVPERYLLLVQTGDEVLDHRLALRFYAGCTQIVQQGGSHAFDGFATQLPRILQFAGLE